MESERIIAAKDERIESLERQLKHERERAQKLERDKEKLQNKLRAVSASGFAPQSKEIVQELRRELSEVRTLRAEYKSLIKDVKAERRRFKNKADEYIEQIDGGLGKRR